MLQPLALIVLPLVLRLQVSKTHSQEANLQMSRCGEVPLLTLEKKGQNWETTTSLLCVDYHPAEELHLILPGVEPNFKDHSTGQRPPLLWEFSFGIKCILTEGERPLWGRLWFLGEQVQLQNTPWRQVLWNMWNLLVRALTYHPLLLLGIGDVTLSHSHKAGIIFGWQWQKAGVIKWKLQLPSLKEQQYEMVNKKLYMYICTYTLLCMENFICAEIWYSRAQSGVMDEPEVALEEQFSEARGRFPMLNTYAHKWFCRGLKHPPLSTGAGTSHLTENSSQVLAKPKP